MNTENKILTIIGARPQIIKAAAISRAIKKRFLNTFKEIILHTGQHYDANMSQVFFDELEIPYPNYQLNVGSSSHGKQTADMISAIEEVLIKENPNAILLYGDTNSTLAGAIAASKIHIPIIHVEAGLRSNNKSMPEEINRIMCDHASTLLFSPTKQGVENLTKEGFKLNTLPPYSRDNPKIYHCGDIMLDNSLFFSKLSDTKTDIIEKYQLTKNNFLLATIHRNNNTDNSQRLNEIFSALYTICSQNTIPIFLPLHPRTAKILEKNLSSELYSKITSDKNFIIAPPVSFLEMIALEKNCLMVLTDSGGVQKEAFYFKKPCLIIRPETEWVELVSCGAAIITDADKEKILKAFSHFYTNVPTNFPMFYGDGSAAEFICDEIASFILS